MQTSSPAPIPRRARFSAHAIALTFAMALFPCCAPKKAITVEEAPVKPAAKVEEPAVAEIPFPQDPNDGLRGIDDMMLSLPSDNDFRATVPVPSQTGNEANAVISRPPTDPPPRVKPGAE